MAPLKGTIPWNKGKKWPQEIIEKFKIAHRGKVLSEEHKKNISKANSGKKRTTEQRDKISKGRKGIVFSKKHKKALSKAHKRRMSNKEEREKISKKLKGRKIPKSVCLKMGKSRSGDKNWNWKGGVTSKDRLERLRFRNLIQKKVIERDDYTCQFCKERGGKLQVDHIQSWVDYVELRFDINNCRTVCMSCHYELTFGKPMPENIKSWGHNLSKKGGPVTFLPRGIKN